MPSLSLETLLWVLPGICFLFAYQRLRDVESVDFTGWGYVFFIVLIGVITILPIQWLFNESPSKPLSFRVLFISSIAAFLLPFIIKLIFIPFVDRLDKEPNFFVPSFFWSMIYFFYPLENRDKFIKNCIEYEGEAVLITVDEPMLLIETSKNKICNIESTVYLGILTEFPYIATHSIDSQVLRILPLLTGYRYVEQQEKEEKGQKKKKEKEKIQWTKKYELNEKSSGIIIPRSKIIHLCAYNEDDHDNIIFDRI